MRRCCLLGRPEDNEAPLQAGGEYTMTEVEIAMELLDIGAQYFCDRRLFALVNKALNRAGLMAHVTKIDSEVWFEVIRKHEAV